MIVNGINATQKPISAFESSWKVRQDHCTFYKKENGSPNEVGNEQQKQQRSSARKATAQEQKRGRGRGPLPPAFVSLLLLFCVFFWFLCVWRFFDSFVPASFFFNSFVPHSVCAVVFLEFCLHWLSRAVEEQSSSSWRTFFLLDQ